MIKYKKFNRGMKYILTVIDALSRFLYMISIKMKCPEDLKRAFTKTFRHAKPKHLLTDRGTEFYGKIFQRFLKAHNVNHYSTYRGQKAARAERVNRTILDRLFRYFRSTGKYRYLDVLPKLVADYKNSVHSVTGMKPIDVNPTNKIFLLVGATALCL